MVQIIFTDFTAFEKRWAGADASKTYWLLHIDLVLQQIRIDLANQQCHYSAAGQSCHRRGEEWDKLYFCCLRGMLTSLELVLEPSTHCGEGWRPNRIPSHYSFQTPCPSACVHAPRACVNLCVHAYIYVSACVSGKKKMSEATPLNETAPWGRSSGLVKTQAHELLYNIPPPHPSPINHLAGTRPPRSRQGCDPRERKMVRMRERGGASHSPPPHSLHVP